MAPLEGLEYLKWALRQEAKAVTSSLRQPLSDTQYDAGFDSLLAQILARLLVSRTYVSVLEIGPGPSSVLEQLPGRLRQRVKKYDAFEPNGVYAARLEERLCSTTEVASPFPSLAHQPDIRRIPFGLQNGNTAVSEAKYDVVLFCHSMYGMKPKQLFVERALGMLAEQPEGGMVVIFHRDGNVNSDGLVCHQTASFPMGVVRVADSDEALDIFAPFLAGFTLQKEGDNIIQPKWRKLCRDLGRRETAYPNKLSFNAPNIMVAFTKQATALPELLAQVPSMSEEILVKNREARLHRPASVVRPTEIQHVQQCVRWALKHGAGLTVMGGGHSDHCVRSNVVAIDMGSFNQIQIISKASNGTNAESDCGALVVVGAGCKVGDIIREAMAVGMTVPLGSRPSVGAGLWLQGGIGHLVRSHGLASDAIVGAVIVSVDSGQIHCVGNVPEQHQPTNSIRPENEADLLWAVKGAGTNFGIVVSVVFKTSAAPTYLVRNWRTPLIDTLEAQLKLRNFDVLVASKLPRSCSADAYLYWDAGQLHLGVTTYESSTSTLASTTPTTNYVDEIWGPADDSSIVDGVGLFETEMYMSGMHGGHSGGKTSSFKRFLFLKSVGKALIARRLVSAIETRPSPLCYLHLLQGGGAVRDVAPEVTAFGCRDWDFACVITGLWPRDQDGTELARVTVQWVYDVVEKLLSMSCGVYGADLGPGPRDATLAARAFGPNRLQLAHLKRHMDPQNVLAYPCPLLNLPLRQRIIILVTGETGAGKDHCAKLWAEVFVKCTVPTVQIACIGDVTKRKYAAASGADLDRLLLNRAYKERHRPAMTAFFKEQLQKRPQLLEENFLDVVKAAGDVDVLFITGMREEAPVANLCHLVPDSRMIEVYVQTSEQIRQVRRGFHGDNSKDSSNSTSLRYRPNLTFDNESNGDESVTKFAENHLLLFIHEDLQHLADMVHSVPNFPRPGIALRHVLGIAQQPGGLELCTSLLQSHFSGDWSQVDAIVCCEVGGLIYASALASRIDVPLVLIREAGKLPPPTFSVSKSSSYITSMSFNGFKGRRIEMERDILPEGASVVVVDDVFSTGQTLCAVMQLLIEAGIRPEDVSAMNVAEFPVHGGRALLRRRGFGKVNIQSVLVFGNV